MCAGTLGKIMRNMSTFLKNNINTFFFTLLKLIGRKRPLQRLHVTYNESSNECGARPAFTLVSWEVLTDLSGKDDKTEAIHRR